MSKTGLFLAKYIYYLNDHTPNNKRSPAMLDFFCGGPEESRTPYLCNANAALYQMSYRPKLTI